MTFFPNQFHVKPDLERGLIRFSARMSEESIYEYWLHPISVSDFAKSEDFSEWCGTEEFKAKTSKGGAIIGIKTSEGMTFIKCSESHLWLLKAHMEAALIEMGDLVTTPDQRGLPSHVTLEIMHRMQVAHQRELLTAVDDLISSKLTQFSDHLLRAVEDKIKSIPTQIVHSVQSAPSISSSADVPTAGSTFIPSDLVNDSLQGRIGVAQETTGDITEALAALRKMKKGDNK